MTRFIDKYPQLELHKTNIDLFISGKYAEIKKEFPEK